jgi:hypothetical protein
VIAVGDRQDGDSGLAPALLAELEALPVAQSWWLTLVADAEFQIDHVIELQNSELALFVDCDRGPADRPFLFHEIDAEESRRAIDLDETLTPSGVMHTLATIGRRESLPPAFQLTLHAERFASPEGLSAGATTNLAAGLAFLEQLLAEPEAGSWRREAQAVSSES